MRILIPTELVARVKEKEPKAIIEVINLLLPMADVIIKSFARRCPHKADDIRSVGYAALTNAVNKCKHNNIAAYARIYINGHIRNFLKEDSVICPPRWVQDKERKNDQFWEPPEIVSMDSEDWVEEARDIYDGTMHGFYEFCLSRLALSKIESRVLHFAREGRTSTEIAALLNVSHTVVNRARSEIKRRFNLLRNNPKIQELYFGDKL